MPNIQLKSHFVTSIGLQV